jgi:hypothetical protein
VVLSLRLAEISQLALTSKRFAPRPEHQRNDGAIARGVLPGVVGVSVARRRVSAQATADQSQSAIWPGSLPRVATLWLASCDRPNAR